MTYKKQMIHIKDAIVLGSYPFEMESKVYDYDILYSNARIILNEEQSCSLLCFLQQCKHIREVDYNIQLIRSDKVLKLIGLMSTEKREYAMNAIRLGTARAECLMKIRQLTSDNNITNIRQIEVEEEDDDEHDE